MQILIEAKTVYGREVFYPVCVQARMFADVSGTKTLTRPQLQAITAAGHEVKIRHPEITL